jgi:hypothetical protein
VRVIPRDPGTYDPGAVPEWARETIARIARECPEALAHHLDQVAETEATKRHAAQNPPPSPEDQRDLLRLVTIRTWQALAGGRPAPGLDPTDLQQAIYQAFAAGDGWHPVDRLCEGWLDLAPQCGLAVDDAGKSPPARRTRRHRPYRQGGDLVRPHRRLHNPHRQVHHPTQVPALLARGLSNWLLEMPHGSE